MKKTYKPYAALLGLALASAQAQAVDFAFTSVTGTLTDALSGLTVTASAWSGTATGNQFESATLSYSTNGLGVFSSGENKQANNADALSNKSATELVLFSFSSAVSLQSLVTYQAGKDSDLNLWAGTGAFSPSGLLPSALPGSAAQFDNSINANGIRTVDLSTFAGSYDWLAISARLAQSDDFVKLTSLAVTPVAQPVPDAATWMTMLAGLGLVGFAVNRRART